MQIENLFCLSKISDDNGEQGNNGWIAQHFFPQTKKRALKEGRMRQKACVIHVLSYKWEKIGLECGEIS